MILRMARPMKRKQSSVHQFRQRIPADIVDKARGMTLTVPIGGANATLKLSGKAQTVLVSLRTRDPREAKARTGTLAAHLERVWQGLREGPRRLPHKETVALAGEVYSLWVDAIESDPGDGETWRKVRESNAAARAGRYGWRASLLIGDGARRECSLEERFGGFVDWCLGRRALAIDADSRTRLLDRVADAMNKAADRLSANARGDYRPDDNLASFPAWGGGKAESQRAPQVTLPGLLEGWWAEAKARNLSLSTYESYAATVKKLGAFLGHDDAGRITADDVIRFKDHRLAFINPRTGKTISPTTVKDNDLAGLKTVLGWAVANRKLTTNPAQGVTLRVAKQVRTRSKGFTDAEANAILSAAFRYASVSEGPKMVAAKRWVPWLCAYTGARLGEMAQLRKQDVREDGGVWLLNITPEAGTVKTKEARLVPLHPHLIAMGFVRFVQAAAPGHLFLRVATGGDIRGPWRSVKNRLTIFARQTVKDPEVAPNHGWRHRFLTVGRSVGIDSGLLHRLTGHAPGSVGDAYGDYQLDLLERTLARMPRYPEG